MNIKTLLIKKGCYTVLCFFSDKSKSTSAKFLRRLDKISIEIRANFSLV